MQRKPQGTRSLDGISINQRRLMRDLNAIGRIGIGNRGGVTRLVFSIKELRSRQVLIHLMRQAGLAIHIDGIGNIFGRLEGSDPKAPAVLAGSHLDTVIHGGKYDGPVGVAETRSRCCKCGEKSGNTYISRATRSYRWSLSSASTCFLKPAKKSISRTGISSNLVVLSKSCSACLPSSV